MKKLFFLLLFHHFGFSQIVNGNFETLVTNTVTNKTFFDSWTGDYGSSFSTQSNTGNYSASIWTWYNYAPGITRYGNEVQNWGDRVMGGGLPISILPNGLTGYYKFDTSNVDTPDSAFIFVGLKKYNSISGKRDTVAYAWMKLPPAAIFTQFSLPIPHLLSIQPDSAVIILASDPINLGIPGTPTTMMNRCRSITMDCAYFTVDDLSFTSAQGIFDLKGKKLQPLIFPNPSTGTFNIKHKTKLILEIINALGESMYTFELNESNNYSTEISNLESGIYFIRGDGFSQKIILTR